MAMCNFTNFLLEVKFLVGERVGWGGGGGGLSPGCILIPCCLRADVE
jgi:hypothetical protein